MAVATVHLIRHGEVHNPRNLVYGRIPGFGLSERGRREAAAVARWAAVGGVSAVYSSPLERAVETSSVIAQVTGADVTVVDELVEWDLASAWQGMSWDQLAEERPDQLEAYLKTPDELDFATESLGALAKRMSEAITSRAEGSIAVVSHADPLKAGLLALTGRSLSDLHAVRLPTGGGIRVAIGHDGVEITDEFEPGR